MLLYAGSGTACMDGAVANLCSPGDRVLVVSAGNFGERWTAIATAYGCDVQTLAYEWGEVPSADDVAGKLDELGGAHAVFLTHSETSTGVVADLEEHAARIRPSGALVVVDAISSLGAVPLETDAWGIDVVVAGSQKALMCPPGLGLVSSSARAYEASARATSPRFFLDWQRTRELHSEEPAATPFTPAIPVIRGARRRGRAPVRRGLETAFERHRKLGRAARAGAKAMGLELFSPDDDSAAVVTAVRMPDGIDAGLVIRTLSSASGSRWRAAARRWARSCGSATSVTSTFSTSRPRSPPWSWPSPSTARRSSGVRRSRPPWRRTASRPASACDDCVGAMVSQTGAEAARRAFSARR